MKWLRPLEERLLRRFHIGGLQSFTDRETPAINRLIARGLLTEHVVICPSCGRHPVMAVRFTARGKIACMILDVLSNVPEVSI